MGLKLNCNKIRSLVAKTVSIIFLILIFKFSVYSEQQNRLNISFEFQAGFVNGNTREYVFENDKCISRLDWDEKYSPYFAFEAKVYFLNVLFFGSIASVIPDKCGYMEDYDFLISGSDTPSHYSKHDAYLDKHIITSTGLGYNINIFNRLSFIPFAGFEYQNRKWSAQDGYLQYPVGGSAWTGLESKQAVKGSVISYEQMLYYPYVGMEIVFSINEMFDFSCEGAYYPIVNVETIDNHYLRLKSFYDTMENGIGYKAGIGLIIYINRAEKSPAYGLNISYEQFSVMNGSTSSCIIGVTDDTYMVDEGYGSGTKSGLWIASLCVIVKFM
jgi:outer membrane protease